MKADGVRRNNAGCGAVSSRAPGFRHAAAVILRVMAVIGASLVVVAASGGVAVAGGESGRVPKPAIIIEKGGKCVADPAVMRRDHMNFLKHQRDDTVREGIRTRQFSLKQCVECHASRNDNRVVGNNQNFCQGCHSYAAVKLDCFECHASRPNPSAASAVPTARPTVPQAGPAANAGVPAGGLALGLAPRPRTAGGAFE
jgi:hypothetical protein